MPEFIGLQSWDDSERTPAQKRISAPFLLEGVLTCRITLTKGATSLIDAADAELAATHCWSYADGYAAAKEKGHNLFLHRLLLGAADDEEVDHKNRIRSDNRRSNIRLVTPAENRQNRPAQRRSPTGARGVTIVRETRCGTTRVRYGAQVQANGKPVLRTTFATLEEAEAAVKAARAKHMTHSEEARHG